MAVILAGSALVLADPVLGRLRHHPTPETATVRSFALDRALELGPLERARAEGRAAVRSAGRGSVLLVGERATETAVKGGDLDRFSILHFATHALTDEQRPDRSAILLARGDSREDGLLQVREIVDLELSGQLVVLSACRSAAGLQVGGEGVLGLARGFFVAGARTVVGSLWPLRDDDAEALFREFYRELRDGASVATALTQARRARIQAGVPPAAWAGSPLGWSSSPSGTPIGLRSARSSSARYVV